MASRLRRLRERHVVALAADVACLVRREGLRSTLRKVRRGVAGASDEVVVLKKRLDEVSGIAFEPRLRLEELDRGTLPALAEFNRRQCDSRATRRFAANLERGCHGYVAYRGGTVAGYYWWVDGGAQPPHPHLRELDLRLGAGDVYGFDFFLAPEHRGEGRAVELLHGVETRLRDLGYRMLWGYVRSDNRPARWLYSVRGYEASGTARLVARGMR
jgi:GNAT superfamily N-acetyltransferase